MENKTRLIISAFILTGLILLSISFNIDKEEIKKSENIVIINGEGYSVAPSLQEDFIKHKKEMEAYNSNS